MAVPVAFLFQLIVGGGAEIVLHLVLGAGFLLTAFAVFDFGPPRWLPWVGCLSIGALGATFLLQGISQLVHNDWLTYLAFQILGQQVETLSGDVFLVWCSATVLLMSHGKVKLVGIVVMALAVSAEIYSYGVRYFGSAAGGVSPLLKLVLLLPFVWLLLESSKKIPLPEAAKKSLNCHAPGHRRVKFGKCALKVHVVGSQLTRMPNQPLSSTHAEQPEHDPDSADATAITGPTRSAERSGSRSSCER